VTVSFRTLITLSALCGSAVGFSGSSFADDPPEFEVRAGDAVEAVAGTRSSATFTVVPAPGRTIHKGAGLIVRLSSSSGGLKIPRKRLGRNDAADPQADAPRFEVPFTAESAGSYTIAADVRFWICGPRTCRPARGAAEMSVTVRANAAVDSTAKTP
jgi:hypothetical protein